jgi:hypothetical protein
MCPDKFLFIQTLDTPEKHITVGMTQTNDGIFLKWMEDVDDEIVQVQICDSDANDILNSIKLTRQMIDKAARLGELSC